MGGDVVQVGVGSTSRQGSAWVGLGLDDEGLTVLFFFCSGDCVGVVQVEEDADE